MTQLEKSAKVTAEVLRRCGDDVPKFATVVEKLTADVLAGLLSHCDDEELKSRVQDYLSAEKLVEVLNKSTGDILTANNISATIPSACVKVERTRAKKQEITVQEKELGLNIQNVQERRQMIRRLVVEQVVNDPSIYDKETGALLRPLHTDVLNHEFKSQVKRRAMQEYFTAEREEGYITALISQACIALWKGVREKSEKGDKSYKAGIKAKYEYYCKEAISPPTQTTTTLNPSPVETHATEPGITAGTTVQLYVPTPFSENTHGPGLSDLPGRVFVATALVFGTNEGIPTVNGPNISGNAVVSVIKVEIDLKANAHHFENFQDGCFKGCLDLIAPSSTLSWPLSHMQLPPPPPPPEASAVPTTKGTKKPRTGKRDPTGSGKVAKPGRKRRTCVVEVENTAGALGNATIEVDDRPSLRELNGGPAKRSAAKKARNVIYVATGKTTRACA